MRSMRFFTGWIRSCSSVPEGVPTVLTTGYSFMRSGRRHSKSGVYWAPNDPLNTIEERNDGESHVAAIIRSLIKALDQAKNVKNLSKVHMKTEFRNTTEDLEKWAANGYKSYRGDLMANAELLEELHQAMQGIHVTLEHTPREIGKPNPVAELLYKDTKFAASSVPSSSISLPEDTPTVYVTSIYEEANNLKKASYATFWAPTTIDGLTKTPIGVTRRLSMFPITHLRADMAGIRDALQEAVDDGLSSVRVVTNSSTFMSHHRFGWTKKNGSSVANRFLYNQIMHLCNQIKVQFVFDNNTDKDEWRTVRRMAEEGIRYPMLTKQRTKLNVDDLRETLKEQNKREVGMYRVRVFKRTSGCPSGWYWDRMDTGEEVDVPPGTATGDGEVLLSVLETASSLGITSLVIRTNREKMFLAAESWMEEWKRNRWNNSMNSPVANVEIWKKIDELKNRIHINWEPCTFDPDIDRCFFSKNAKKRGRPKLSSTIS